LRKAAPVQKQIESLMSKKLTLEQKINELDTLRYEGQKVSYNKINKLFEQMDALNKDISELLKEYKAFFNPYWGEILRAGYDESRYAEQVEKYACIYITKVSDLTEHSPKTYFRPIKRILPHEAETME